MIDFNNYINVFKQISGIISVGIVHSFSSPEIHLSDDNLKEFKKFIEDLCHIVPEKILDFNINSFMFKIGNQYVVCYYEQDTLLALFISDIVNFNILKSKVDEFLNDLLISS